MYIGIHDKYNHCFEDVMMTYMFFENIPYVYMYADAWKFYSDVNIIDEFGGCEYKCSYPHEEAIQNIIGIKIKKIECLKEENINKLLEQNKILVIHYDAMYCDWSIAYQKYHLQHYFILNKVENGIIQGNDPYLSKIQIQLSLDELRKNNGQVFMWEMDSSFDDSNKRKILKMIMQINDSMFEQIKAFGEKIGKVNVYNYGREYKQDMTACPMYQKITYVVNSRYNLSKVFYYVSVKEKKETYKEIARDFFNVATLWEEVKGNIIRLMMNQVLCLKNSNKVKEMIYKISDAEETIYNNLIKIIDIKEK